MRTRPAALLVALILICACAASASAQQPVPVASAPPLSQNPPAQLPAADHKPKPRPVTPAVHPAPLPRTGADVRLISLVGLLMLAAGTGIHRLLPDGRPRRR